MKTTLYIKEGTEILDEFHGARLVVTTPGAASNTAWCKRYETNDDGTETLMGEDLYYLSELAQIAGVRHVWWATAIWQIRDREAGNVINTFYSIEEAEEALQEYEDADRADGSYTENFYEIVQTWEEA